MNQIRGELTMMECLETDCFYGKTNPQQLVEEFGSPLYVYNEAILRNRCREMKTLSTDLDLQVNYSTKANSNLRLLEIIRSEGLHADAMSPGEIHLLKQAGFASDAILYVGNNVSEEELQYATATGVTVSVDSLAQLERYGRLYPGGRVAVRFNPGIGAGHHAKVITGGTKTKFGVNPEAVPEVKQLLTRYRLSLVGINQHIGSLFMNAAPYLAGVEALLTIARQFGGLEFVDFGGGFGIPYQKQAGQARLGLGELGLEFNRILKAWVMAYGKKVRFVIEPGRYLVAECGALLGTVHALKQNGATVYIGTDLGFNVLMRPVLYDSYHDLEVYRAGQMVNAGPRQKVTVVGNICETGDIIAADRLLPELREGDLLGVMDAGAYGYVMSSNYNNRLRPAEVLIREDGNPLLIRRRERLEDLMLGYQM